MNLDKKKAIPYIKAALKEDIGMRDVTSNYAVSNQQIIKGVFLAKSDFVVCGLDIAEWIFSVLDYSIRFKPLLKDGDEVYKGKEIAYVEGYAKPILAGERTALNFIMQLSAVSTKTKKFVEKVKKYNVKILDTRKTIPNMRYFQRYAVRIGGGCNHRFGLWDQILIKDNHIKCFGKQSGISDFSTASESLESVKKKAQKNYKIEIEVSHYQELEKVCKLNPDIIMLDNMDVENVKKAVLFIRQRTPKTTIETSGNINYENIEEYAQCGIDTISIGELTHTIQPPDISFEIF